VIDYYHGHSYGIKYYKETEGINKLDLDNYNEYFPTVNSDIIQKPPLSLPAESSKHQAAQLCFPGDFIAFNFKESTATTFGI
jgi:hypothetical protein